MARTKVNTLIAQLAALASVTYPTPSALKADIRKLTYANYDASQWLGQRVGKLQIGPEWVEGPRGGMYAESKFGGRTCKVYEVSLRRLGSQPKSPVPIFLVKERGLPAERIHVAFPR